MNKITIVSDSSHDLDYEYINEKDIKIARFFVRLDGETYLRDGIDINRVEFYEYLRENPDMFPKTSLPSVEDYMNIFKSAIDKGEDIICFTLASVLSGSYQSAKVAADIIKEEKPESKIYIMDSESASLGVGLLIKKAVEFREAGKDIDYIQDSLKEVIKTLEVYICLETLDYLKNGGRLSKAGAFAGKLLNIKPVVSLIDNELNIETAVRGRKKAIEEGLKLLDERIKDDPEGYDIFVVHGDEEELARKVKKTIELKYGIEIEFDVALVSAAIIAHIGPGAIAIGCSNKI